MGTRPRIVSLLPSATEIVCALGLEESLVGVTHECDFPPSVVGKPVLTSSHISHAEMSSAEIDHAVRTQLDGHGSIYGLDEKLLAELKPDLVITQELCEVCAVSYKTVVQAARVIESDARVVSLEPNNIRDIFANIRTVGELTGAAAEADTLVRDLTVQLDALAVLLTEVETRPRTLVLEWLEPPFAPGHWVPEQVAFAGGDAGFGNAGGKSRTTTAEEIQTYAPEVIVLAPCGYYKEDTLRALERTRLPRGWHDLPAVRLGQVWAVDATSYFSRPGPRVVEGAEILLKVIHPEIFGEPDAAQAVRVPREMMLAEDS
ncbi:MAG: iron complex transport system substrate-binding protein [Acidobacteriota bacterium]|jgi:iron complex transport system substrate-binding protein|nr:iron complex transport system substrate-binding protein [Acidobacteriota bacterium]